MATLLLAPRLRSSIGFDRMPLLLTDAFGRGEDGDRWHTLDYPPYNIEKSGLSQYRIIMALAGFRKEDIEILAEEQRLTVRGRLPERSNATCLHRGIAREFERQFDLAEDIEVTGATMADDLLVIDLKRERPQKVKPRKIEIERVRTDAPSPEEVGKRAA
jgi:molecular chaperone IbpA